MFKRVEKRRLKKAEEEELSLDDDMKEILGMHDTDSEESASESSDSDAPEDEQEEEAEGHALDMDEEADEEMDAEDDGQPDEDDEDEDEDPNITVTQALEDPVYVVSVLPEVKACIICPGKILKGVKMVQLHRTSNAHERRLKQFKHLSVDADPTESAWEILRRNAEENPKLSLTPSMLGQSKRAEKKKAYAEHQRLRREKQKQKRAKEAKKKTLAASCSNAEPPAETSKSETTDSKKTPKKLEKGKKESTQLSTSTSPPKKKRKFESATGEPQPTKDSTPKSPAATDSPPTKRGKGRPRITSEAEAPLPTAHTEKKSGAVKEITAEMSQESVKNIVRSTSDRAKSARARALSASKGGRGARRNTVVVRTGRRR